MDLPVPCMDMYAAFLLTSEVVNGPCLMKRKQMVFSGNGERVRIE